MRSGVTMILWLETKATRVQQDLILELLATAPKPFMVEDDPAHPVAGLIKHGFVESIQHIPRNIIRLTEEGEKVAKSYLLVRQGLGPASTHTK